MTSRHDPIPALPGEKGRRYLCEDSDGNWYYLNHAHTWQHCPRPEVPDERLDAGREWLRVAWHEFNAIRARDGAPVGVSEEWEEWLYHVRKALEAVEP